MVVWPFGLFVVLIRIVPGLLGELLCASCTDIPSPALCGNVAKCGEYDECFVEMYLNSFGSLRFDLGCRDAKFCGGVASSSQSLGRRSHRAVICEECCNQTACNFAGCGGSGNPPISQRGPLCFNCMTELSLDGCSTVKQCNRGEVCVLKANSSPVTGQRVYTTDCMQAKTCDLAYNSFVTALHGKRNFDHSIHVGSECKLECCDTDFCNRACNITTLTHSRKYPKSSDCVSTSPSLTSSVTMSTISHTTLSNTTGSPAYSNSSTPPFNYNDLTSVSSVISQTGCRDHIQLCTDPGFQSFVCQQYGLSLYCPKSCHLC